MQNIILFFMASLLVALCVEPLSRRIRLPFAAALVIVGFVGSEILVANGIDTGLRWDSFQSLILYIFLPVLIFEAAFNLDLELFQHNLTPILVLAIPIMLLSAGITAVLLYFSIAHPTGFPWIAALITGALLSATDPAAVLAVFKEINAPKRLSVIINGESLFNDATAIVLFSLFIGIATSTNDGITLSRAILSFLTIFLGGVLVGAVVGFLAVLLLRLVSESSLRGVVTLIGAYGAFYIADVLLHVSGVMAVLLAGIFLGHASRKICGAGEAGTFLHSLWAMISWVAGALLFLLSGVTVQLGMFADRWLAILLGIAAVLIARALGVFTLFPLLNRMPGQEPLPGNYQKIMLWGGVRGAVTLALALSLPTELDYWYTIQSIAYGVVLFTLFVQAPTIAYMMRHLRIT